ncbi:mid1-interacting protein 1A-like [Haliotis rubra]|uniref:mid1-interacting protein 1A-like n=1 Tax=Haliotis rubra TaxID=36100 RepID=UPI001EE622C0|nr:mid1-interacting protein 1A-like [Haliotis rubra]
MENDRRENTVYHSSDSNQQSLLAALNRFVQAVNAMDDTVMIPCRLRDMEVTARPEITVENNNKAVLPTLPAGADLYSFYSMLNAIKQEIITGPPAGVSEEATKEESESDDNGNNSRKTAAAFRHHLKGLFDLLHHLTETARYLSSRYENDVTQTSSVSSFAL